MSFLGLNSLRLETRAGDQDETTTLETERSERGFHLFKSPIWPLMSYIVELNRLYLVQRQYEQYIREVEVNLCLMGNFRTLQLNNMLYLSTCSLPHLDCFVLLNPFGDCTKLPQLKVPRTAHSLCGFTGLIFASGGIKDYQEMRECESFSPTARRWRCRAPLIKSEAFHGSVMVNQSQIYIFGGSNSAFIRIQTYRLETDSWLSCLLKNIEKLVENKIVIFNEIQREESDLGFKLYHFSTDEARLLGMYECAPIRDKLPYSGLCMQNYEGVVDQQQEMCLLRERNLDLRFKLQLK